MRDGWKEALIRQSDGATLLWDYESRVKFSNDMHHLSPVLKSALHGKLADCIAIPDNAEALNRLIAVAAEYEVPITPRGGGTCNYGQCVPLTGGIVIDVTKLDRILEIGEGFMRAEPGANIGKMEAAARDTGQEMFILPTTYKKSTIAGFLMGGFGGVGSIRWGTIWDGMVQSFTVRTVEPEPKTVIVGGDDIQPYLHSYGTIGMITEVQVALAPKIDWKQYGVSFADWETAAKFGIDIAENPAVRKRLISINEWPIPSYFTPFKLASERALVFLQVDETSEAEMLKTMERWEGQLDLTIPYDGDYKKLGVSDFSFGHYRLWVQKVDPAYTNIQMYLDRNRFIDQLHQIKAEFPDLLVHIELLKKGGELQLMGTPIFRYRDEARIQRLKAYCESVGAKVDDPHTYDLEGGGRAYTIEKLWEIKHRNDPLGLLNQNKLSPPKAAST